MKTRTSNRSKKVSPSCRNNGPCAVCTNDRTHANRRQVPADEGDQRDKVLYQPHPDDLEDVRAALEEVERGEVITMSIEEFEKWMRGE